MNIESLARLIESADPSVFRTIANTFLSFIGLVSADYCDGPYDGGKDFAVIDNKVQNLKVAVQISVEKDWQKKIIGDSKKVAGNFGTNIMYFISSRRIPEASFQDIKEEILQDYGLSVTRYDNQAIASRFIKKGKVRELFTILGYNLDEVSRGLNKYLGPKNEAISAFLLFGKETKKFRAEMFDAVVKSLLHKRTDSYDRDKLVNEVISEFSLATYQKSLINASVDRLIQKQEIIFEKGKIILSDDEKSLFEGISQSSEYEASELCSEIEKYLASLNIKIEKDLKDTIILNYLELSINIVGKLFDVNNQYEYMEREHYFLIKEVLETKIGKIETEKILNGLTEVVANSNFAKHVAAGKLFNCLLNSSSNQLINAFGGACSINVYFDASVVMPLICGVLFEPASNRFGHSGKLLYNLLKIHEFEAFIPTDYLEEVAAHLISACQDYRHILDSGEDLSYSSNAFVSHFSSYVRTPSGDGTTFSEYVRNFGIRVNDVSKSMSDSAFYSLRDRVMVEVSRLASRYGLKVEEIKVSFFDKIAEKINENLHANNIHKPNVLVEHDARVIKYLEGQSISSEYVKVLCTWDKLHFDINPDGENGYYVLSPIGLIDLLSLAKHQSDDIPLSHLKHYSMIQNEKKLELSSQIWDAIAKLDNEKLSDIKLISMAKSFKENFLAENSGLDEIPDEKIEKEWLAWKKQM